MKCKSVDGEKFFDKVKGLLDERSARLVAAAASIGMGRGGVSQVSQLAVISRPAISNDVQVSDGLKCIHAF